MDLQPSPLRGVEYLRRHWGVLCSLEQATLPLYYPLSERGEVVEPDAKTSDNCNK